jgi:hypothetical protein
VVRALLLLLVIAAPAFAEGKRYHVTAQLGALAPNAGGQEAYALKLATNDWEASVFSNQYLLAGSLPMTGVIYDYRFPICDDSCFWQLFFQAGGGLSNGGPVVDMSWGTVIPLLPLWLPTRAPPYYPALRIDFTTQMILIRWRAVTWSYPLWVGISVPF